MDLDFKKFILGYDVGIGVSMTPQQWDKIFTEFKKDLRKFWAKKGVTVNWE